VWTLIRSAAIDLARHGIRANGVAPGVAETPLAELVVHNEHLAPQYLKTIPLGRFAQPVDVANCALFLASDEAAYVTGQTIVIDGGQTLGIRGDLGQAAEGTG
jgi:3-oxoacyl-[acyl-carrier protein] reductase